VECRFETHTCGVLLKFEEALTIDLKKDLLSLVNVLSSGTLSYAELARRKHPYSVLRTNKSLMYGGQPYFINEHSGRFKRGWVADETLVGFSIKNLTPYATKLFGGIPGLTVARNVLDNPFVTNYLKTVGDRRVAASAKTLAKEIESAFGKN